MTPHALANNLALQEIEHGEQNSASGHLEQLFPQASCRPRTGKAAKQDKQNRRWNDGTMTTHNLASPRVSVVMPAYNDLRFIFAAIESIIQQTFTDFELIVVDDGSGQAEVFASLLRLDPRIRCVSFAENRGICAALNHGIAEARGEIIARLDADDIAEPTRLARLVAKLDADPELGLVGSWARFVTESDEPHHSWRTPVTDLEVRWRILFANPFCHPSVAFRRTCFDQVGGYNSGTGQSEDYDLWLRMLEVCRAENIPEILVRYRVNSRGLTATNTVTWRQRAERRRRPWAQLGVEYDPKLDLALQDFTAGFDITNCTCAAHAYRAVLVMLRGFLAAPRPIPRRTDEVDARHLRYTIIKRVLADHSIGLAAMARLWPLCWRLDRTAAIKGLANFIILSRRREPASVWSERQLQPRRALKLFWKALAFPFGSRARYRIRRDRDI